MKHSIKFATGVMILAWTSGAQAGVAIDLFGGMRQGKAEAAKDSTSSEKAKTYNVPGSDLGVILAYKPPMLPLQFGVYASTYGYKTDDMYKDDLQPDVDIAATDVKGRISGINYGPHVRAWIPLGWFQPYAEAGYLFGSQTEKVTYEAVNTTANFNAEFNEKYDTTATLLGVGLRFSPIPFFGVSFGYEMHMGQRTLKSATEKTTVSSGSSTTESESEMTLTSDMKKSRAFNSGAFRAGFTFAL